MSFSIIRFTYRAIAFLKSFTYLEDSPYALLTSFIT